MITITVTPQQMLDVLIASDIEVSTAKSIILDLILASDGGLKLPNGPELEKPIEEAVDQDYLAEEQVVDEDPRPVRKPKRVSFREFGGTAEFKGN